MALAALNILAIDQASSMGDGELRLSQGRKPVLLRLSFRLFWIILRYFWIFWIPICDDITMTMDETSTFVVLLNHIPWWHLILSTRPCPFPWWSASDGSNPKLASLRLSPRKPRLSGTLWLHCQWHPQLGRVRKIEAFLTSAVSFI